jgi:drug/metabolite transporter (DMT)-like permease
MELKVEKALNRKCLMEHLPQTGKGIAKFPHMVWLIITITIAAETVAQMVWKSVVLGVPESAGFMETVRTVTVQPMFYLLLGIFGVQFIFWILLLAKADLSYARPITALSLISVVACSVMFFGEKVDMMRMIGIIMILVGVWFISSTDHNTRVTHIPSPRATTGQPLEIML